MAEARGRSAYWRPSRGKEVLSNAGLGGGAAGDGLPGRGIVMVFGKYSRSISSDNSAPLGRVIVIHLPTPCVCWERASTNCGESRLDDSGYIRSGVHRRRIIRRSNLGWARPS